MELGEQHAFQIATGLALSTYGGVILPKGRGPNSTVALTAQVRMPLKKKFATTCY